MKQNVMNKIYCSNI